jgi:mercuric ion transport protein
MTTAASSPESGSAGVKGPNGPNEPNGPGVSVVRTAAELAVAGLAALLASGCCVAPLVLALAGVSGAWIGQMRRIEPWSPWLLGVSFVALALAAWRLYRRAPGGGRACDIGDAACRRANVTARRWFWGVAVLALVPIVVPLAAPWFY